MSTTSGPLSPLPSASLPLPITITFPTTVFPSTSDSSVAETSTRTTAPTHTSITTTTNTETSHSSTTSLTQSSSISTTTTSSGTLSTFPSSSSASSTSITTSSSPTSTPVSQSVTRTQVPSPSKTTSTTHGLVGTLAPSDDTGGTGENGPTVASVEEEITHLKETRNIVIAVLSALALVAVLVAVRAVILRRRSAGAPPPAPLPQHKSPGPLLTADTPLGGASHGAPWPFVAHSEWQPPQLHRLAPPPRPHYAPRNPSGNRASILPQTVDAWIAGAGSSSVDLRSQRTPVPSPGDRHNYKPGYI